MLVGTVVGFPHGSTTTAFKVAETRALVAAGANEIDMVLAIGRLRGGDPDDLAARHRGEPALVASPVAASY